MMSTAAVIALIVLLAIIAAGVLIKLHTKRLLRDMDGVADAAIVHDEERSRLLRSGKRT